MKNAKPTKKSRSTGRRKERSTRGRKVVEFANMKGRKVERIAIYSSREYHSLAIEFQDQTALDVEIEPGFTLKAAHEERQPNDVKILRRWPTIQSN